MKEVEDTRLALNALAVADGAGYRRAVADLHVASDALLVVIRVREAWLHETLPKRHAEGDSRNAKLDAYWIARLNEYEQMWQLYQTAYRAATAYAEVVAEEPVAVEQGKLEGV